MILTPARLVMLFSLVSLSLLFPGFCRAQESPQYATCNKTASTQMELNGCAGEEEQRADAELNRAYQNLLTLAKNDALVTAKIKKMERAWIVFRDAYIDARFPAENKRVEYGSIYPMELSLLRAKLARQQTEAVKMLSQEYAEK